MSIDNRELGSGWVEPESAANDENQPEYPYNNVTYSESGHIFELDDTPSRERVRLQHRSGTFIEMHPNGDEVHKVYGDGYEITIKDRNVLIKGHCSVTIEGDSVVNVKGNKTERIEGNYELVVDGDFTSISKGQSRILSEADMQVGAGCSSSSPSSGSGSLRLVSGNDLDVAADVMIGGKLYAKMITSETAVDAGTGVTAGPLGFVTVTGGISVSVAGATPGRVYSPLAEFGTMKAILMTDIMNSKIYNFHIHRTPHGVSSPPLTKFI